MKCGTCPPVVCVSDENVLVKIYYLLFTVRFLVLYSSFFSPIKLDAVRFLVL